MLTREFSATTNHRIGKGLLWLAACLALLAMWRWVVEARFLEAAYLSYGEVVSVNSKQDDAKVVFHDAAGHPRTASPWVKSSSRKYRVGERIAVLVNPSDPTTAKFNEPMQIWANTHLCLYLSGIAGVIGLLVIKKVLVIGPLRQKSFRIGM
ncbi:hypothetical protein J2X20_005120 [Pelomonas saccharophila]|uniref:DUF3592 domain-containing protein n=1 Tax=Roseateles saccharophilus TaxID=304 RepID=A0ABU1YUB2_ROSSA|nr:DUF3592 domain-containing protein [Roseateles saccharophilus]MDR7272437.1 hypothetical protein [Roseateles saccharophilus]